MMAVKTVQTQHSNIRCHPLLQFEAQFEVQFASRAQQTQE